MRSFDLHIISRMLDLTVLMRSWPSQELAHVQMPIMIRKVSVRGKVTHK